MIHYRVKLYKEAGLTESPLGLSAGYYDRGNEQKAKFREYFVGKIETWFT